MPKQILRFITRGLLLLVCALLYDKLVVNSQETSFNLRPKHGGNDKDRFRARNQLVDPNQSRRLDLNGTNTTNTTMPSKMPSTELLNQQSNMPSTELSNQTSNQTSNMPSTKLSNMPSTKLSNQPSKVPTEEETTNEPTNQPTKVPANEPTNQPTTVPTNTNSSNSEPNSGNSTQEENHVGGPAVINNNENSNNSNETTTTTNSFFALNSNDGTCTADGVCDSGLVLIPGIPNLDFLGMGYDILYGNPRGSDESELDPGFRGRIMELNASEQIPTLNRRYIAPSNVNVKSVSTCKFDSSSSQLSSLAQYAKQLSKEVITRTVSEGRRVDLTESVAADIFSSVRKFAKSENSKKMSESIRNDKSVMFEARAVCTEFEASFPPYAENSIHAGFLNALQSLPTSSENNNTNTTTNSPNLEEYAKFIEAFGTHYVKRVVLGGKHVYSTSMTAEDVLDLTKDNIDIASTLSFHAQFTISSPEYVKDRLVGNVTSGSKNEKFTSNARERTAWEKITKKDLQTSQVSIGGRNRPILDGDWKAWADSVREEPMPIIYELEGLWKLMDEQRRDLFLSALATLHDIQTSDYVDSDGSVVQQNNPTDDDDIGNIIQQSRMNDDVEPNDIQNALHFGVFDPEGHAITSYTVDPNTSFRPRLELDKFPGRSAGPSQEMPVYKHDCQNGGCFMNSWVEIPHGDDYYACGAKIRDDSEYDRYEHGAGITEITFIFCNIWHWSQNPIEKSLGSDSHQEKDWEAYGQKVTTIMCNAGSFLIDVRAQYQPNEGITALEMRCKPPGSTTTEYDDEVLYFDTDAPRKDGRDGYAWTDWTKRSKDDYFITGGRVEEYFAGKDGPSEKDYGVTSLFLKYSKLDRKGPANKMVAYTAQWGGVENTATPIFASTLRGDISRNTKEDHHEFGFVALSESDEEEEDSDAYLGLPQDDDDYMKNKQYLRLGSFASYALGAEPRTATIGFTNFKGDVALSNLPSFCLLAADNILSNPAFISGSVHPIGYPFNSDADIGFEISKESKREYTIEFDEPFIEMPTLIAFPRWFPGRVDRHPIHNGELAVTLRGCTDQSCRLTLGSKESKANKHLGFDFLALDGALETSSNIVHGRVVIEKVTNFTTNETIGYHIDESEMLLYDTFTASNDTLIIQEENTTITLFDKETDGNYIFHEPVLGGIKIDFTTPFGGIPTIIVIPELGDKEYNDVDISQSFTNEVVLPFCAVEYATKKGTFVKCGLVNTAVPEDSTYEPLSFHFVAVGPPPKQIRSRR